MNELEWHVVKLDSFMFNSRLHHVNRCHKTTKKNTKRNWEKEKNFDGFNWKSIANYFIDLFHFLSRTIFPFIIQPIRHSFLDANVLDRLRAQRYPFAATFHVDNRNWKRIFN